MRYEFQAQKAGNQRRQLRASASKGTNQDWPKHGCGSIRSRLKTLDVHAHPLKAQRRTPLLVHTSYSGDPLAAGLAFQRQRKETRRRIHKTPSPRPSPSDSFFPPGPSWLVALSVRCGWVGMRCDLLVPRFSDRVWSGGGPACTI